MASKKPTIVKKAGPCVVKGLVKWAKVFEPDELSGKYNINVYLDNPAYVKQIAEFGIPIKSDADGSFFQPYAYAKDPDGIPIKFTNIFDAGMNPWEHGKLIGNGSLCNIEFFPKEWEYKGKQGVSARLLRIQVLKHVSFGGTLLKAEPEYVDAADESSPFAVAG